LENCFACCCISFQGASHIFSVKLGLLFKNKA
jgi:hypothetical protein